jgi:hypothetical protein
LDRTKRNTRQPHTGVCVCVCLLCCVCLFFLCVGLCLVSAFWSKDKPCSFCICKCFFSVCVCCVFVCFCRVKLQPTTNTKNHLCVCVLSFGGRVSPLPAPFFERVRAFLDKGGSELGVGRKTKPLCFWVLFTYPKSLAKSWKRVAGCEGGPSGKDCSCCLSPHLIPTTKW